MLKPLPLAGFCLLLTTLFSSPALAQLSGTKTIPGDYPTVTAAITALNASGVGSGGVTFNIAAGYTETLTLGPLSITATGTLANPIIFQKDPLGVGANPVITAYTGGTGTPGTTTQDGIWRLLGSDYVTISSINLSENVANSGFALMEYGFALYKAAANNGCQNVTIQNCTVTLNRDNVTSGAGPVPEGSIGIEVMNSVYNNATANLGSNATGQQSNNKFYGNTIQNVNIGIALIGVTPASPYTNGDRGNDVGGSTAGTGNTIINYGGGAGTTNPASAIRTLNQYDINIANNTINSNNGSGVDHPALIRGIYTNNAPGAAATIANNTITLKAGVSTAAAAGIENAAGSTAFSNTISITNNQVLNSTSSSTGIFYGIRNTSSASTVSITGNTVKGNTMNAANTFIAINNSNTAAAASLVVTGNIIQGNIMNANNSFSAINNSGAVTTTLNLSSNQIGNGTGGPVTYTVANSLAQTFINNSGGAATAALTISSNNFQGITYSVSGTGGNTYISNTAPTLSQTISSNTFNGLSIATSGNVIFISNNVSLSGTGTQTINSNSIVGTFQKTVSGGTVTLYTATTAVSASGSVSNMQNNGFSNITVTGTTAIAGWVVNDTGSAGRTFTGNNFVAWTGGSGTTTAVNLALTATNNTVAGNSIISISGAGAVNGMIIGAGNNNVFGNTIRTLSSSGAASAVNGISMTAGSNNRVYNCRIFDLTANGATGTANGISISGSTIVTALIYNNLIGDIKAPTASATTDAVRGISVIASTPNSTINVYYSTVYLSATSTGINFNTSAIFHQTNATFSTAALNMRNNILYNVSTAKGSGKTAAYRRSSTTLTNYAPTSNNNMFFAGTPSTSNLLFYDGTNLVQNIAAYKALVSTADQASVAEDLTGKFVSTSGLNSNFLHIVVGSTTFVESGGANIAGIVGDADGQSRQGNPGYSGTGTAPDIGADEFEGIKTAALAGSYNVGTGQTYTTLTGATGLFASINNLGLSGNTVVNITSDLAEDGATALNAWNEIGAGGYTLTIQPNTTTVRNITGDVVGGLIRFNGASRVTIDGSAGTTSSYLNFSNTNAANSTGTAFTFINGASNNTIKYSTISATANSSNGVVLFSTSSGATGNSNNTLSNNNINATVVATPGSVAVYSAGTVGKENSNNTISNNFISNYRDRGLEITGTGSTGWTISGNSFFNGSVTGSIDYATNSTLFGIRVSGGSGYTITGNYIGGSAALAGGGSASYSSSTGVIFYDGIFLSTTSATPASLIKGNTITAINVTCIPTSTSVFQAVFYGIETGGSGITIGGTLAGEGNIIGSNSVNGAIKVTTNSAAANLRSNVRGIHSGSTGGSILNNQIGGFDISNLGGATAGASFFSGIALANATAQTPVSGNVIGSTGVGAASNSVRVLSTSNSVGTTLTGIAITNTVTSTVTVDGNTIQNMSFQFTGGTANGIIGISNAATTGSVVTISNNTISTNSTSTANVTGGNIIGIQTAAASTTVTINNNIITANANTGTNPGNFYGINATGANTPTLIINSNTFSNNSAGDLSGLFAGIFTNATPTTLSINGNTFVGNTSANTTGLFNAIFNSGAVTGSITINSNNIGNGTGGPITFSVINGTNQIYVRNTGGAATATLAITSNNFQGINYTTAPTGNLILMLNQATTLSQAITSNTFTNLNVNLDGNFTFISNNVAVSATGSQNVSGNAIVGTFTKSANTTSTVTLFTSTTGTSSSGAVFTHNNNNFSGITVTGATTVAGWVVTDPGTGTHTISGNTFSNWSGGTSAITGISTNLAGASSVSSNTITNFSSGGVVNGMATAGVEGLSQNNIHTLASSGTNSGVNGISITAGSGSVFRNKIYDLSSSSATNGIVSGITISGTTLTSTTIYNNYIGDITHPTVSSATDFVRGINITTTATATVNVYYNTIYIAGTSAGATFSTSCINHAWSTTPSTGTLNLRNNILVNYSTPKGANGRAVALRRSGTNPPTLANYASTSNNNLVYAGTPGTNNLLYYDGTNSDQTIGAYQSRLTPADNLSVTENVLAKFLSTTGSSGTYLHIDANQPTAIEGGAVNITGITDDYDGQIRFGNPGYSGPASTAPDIGADEIFGVETVPPAIVYSLLPNTASTSNVTLSGVTITDASGVNVTAGTKPRVYYKRSTDANALADNTSTTNGWKFTEATNGASPFSFTIDYSLLYGGATGLAGSIQYFVVAQDIATVPNVGINSGTFANQPTSVALTTNAFPLTGTINSYAITFSGSYNVGSTEVFTSLTKSNGLFAAINSAGLGGNITINVTSNLSEDGAVALNAWTESGIGGYTLTIQPSAATTRTISGDAISGMVVFNDADRVTIDGRSGGSGIYLKFINTNSSVTTGAAIKFINGATNNNILFTDIEAVTNSTTGALSFSTSGSATGNTNIVVDNCTITSTVGSQTGSVAIYSGGTSGKENSTISITNNSIHGFADRGIDVAVASSDWTITGNSVYNGDVTGLIPAYASGSAVHGIRVSTGAGYNVSNNFIGGTQALATGANAVYSSAGDVSFSGILMTTSSASPASSIKGNTITAITVSSVPTVANSVAFVGIGTAGSGITIGGASVGEGNTIGSTTANGAIAITTTTASATNTSAVTGIDIASAGGSIVANKIGGIDVTNIGAAPAGSTVRGLRVNNTTSPTPISANIIGSTTFANSIRITAASTAPSPVLQGLSLGASIASVVSVDNNTIQNLSNLSTTSSGSFAGISIAGQTSAAVTVTTNTVRDINAAANASANSGIYNAIFSQAPSAITNNTITNVTVSATGTAAQLRGIAVSGAVAHTISGNSISSLSTASTKVSVVETGDPGGFALTGILNSATTSGQVISGNTLFTLSVSNNAHTNIVIAGIALNGASSSGDIFQNRVHGLINNSTGSLTLPGMVGVMAFDGSFNFYNNAIRADNAANTNAVRVYAMLHATTNAWNYIYNTLVVSGSGAGTTRSAAFGRTVTGTVFLRNNILLNTRTFIGPNFAISNPGGATNWSGTASDYNDIFTSSNANNTGEWGASAVTFAQWQSLSTGDSHSVSQIATFIASTHDLALSTASNCLLNNAATPITTPIVVSTDINNVSRPATPDIGAYEFDFVTTTVGASNDSPVCDAALVNLSADPGTLTGPTYSWKDPNNSVISTLRNPAVSAIPGIYTVTITDGTGCPYITTTTVAVIARPTAVISGSAVICNGSATDLQLDVTGTGTISGVLSTGDVFSGPSPQIIQSVSPTTTTIYTISSLHDDNCTSIPADLTGSATITVTPGGDWGGTADGDWNNAANWCGGVPSSSINVHIVSGTPFSPTISLPGALAQALTIDPGAALTMTGTATLDLKGDLSNDGDVFIDPNTTISFSGNSTQSITGNLVNFQNISVTNTSAPGLQIESSQNLFGVLSLGTDVTVDADGSGDASVFTLKSLAEKPTQDASIAALPSGATVTGNVTVERFMAIYPAPNDKIYRYISSPVANGTVADIQNEIYVTGGFTGSSTCTGCSGNSMFGYDETVTTDINNSHTADYNDGYIAFPTVDNTETFVPGKGYAIYVRGHLLPSAMWNLSGTISQGNVTPVELPVSYTDSGVIANDGWNLVGNPYPSTIDWNASGWTKTNLGVSIYITDNSTPVHQYATWNGVTGTNGGTQYIAMGQAFFVKADGVGAPVLNASENVKTATQTTYFRTAAPENLLRITMTLGNVRDEAVVHFRDDATSGFDAQADALKLPNTTFNLSTIANTSSLAINSLPLQGCSGSVKLNITNAAAGNYALNFSQFESFGNGTAITLTDNFTATTIDVLTTSSYSFTVTGLANTYGSERFVLNFVSKKYDAVGSNGIVCTEGTAQLTASGAPAGGRYNWYESQDSQVALTGNASVFTTPVISESHEYFVAAVDRWGCEGTRVSVLADVKKPGAATVTEASGVLTSSYTAGNQWLLNDVEIAGQTETTFTPVKTGTYKVRVTTTDGCVVTSAGVDFVVKDPPVVVNPPPVETTTGLGDDQEFSVKFIPNPVSDKLTVIITGGGDIKDVRIANQLGQVVGRIPVRKSSSTATGEFVMKDLPAGVYIIHVIGDKNVHTERVVKL